jgi:hypothetical protein
MGQKAPGSFTPADVQSVDSCFIEGNTLNGWDTHGIYVQAAKNCYVLKWSGTNPHYQLFTGAAGLADRAVYVGFPAGNIFIDGVDATQTVWPPPGGYAITIEHGVDPTVNVTNILVAPPNQPVQDLR